MVDLKRPADLPNRLLVGLSAGLDSTVLLQALVAARESDWPELDLQAIHVHHGLQPSAQDFQAQASKTCDACGVRLQLVHLQIDSEQIRTRGLEAAAREARYAAFYRCLAEDQALVLGHHLDDQVETMLLQWMRGAGLDGLASMQVWSPVRRLWRPLLGMSKQQLRKLADAQALSWIEDPTNADQSFHRNRLREVVMPLLLEMRQGALQAMGRSIELLQQDKWVLDELTQADWAECLARQVELDQLAGRGYGSAQGLPVLNRQRWLMLSEARGLRVLRHGLAQVGAPMPPARRLQEFARQLRHVSHDTRCQMDVAAAETGEKASFQVSFRAGFVFFSQ